MTVMVSPFTDPPWNIALEEAMRGAAREGACLFCLYRNERSVIVGRNQSASAELTPGAALSGIRAYRRTTGGGAVYHDRGNVNWSFALPGGLDLRPSLLSLVASSLRPLGVVATADARGGLYLHGFKIGGSASAAGGGALLFHGTLLVDSDLDCLRLSLAAHREAGYRPGAVRSVASPVANLSGFVPGLGADALMAALAESPLPGRPVPSRPRDARELFPAATLAEAARRFSSDAWTYRAEGRSLDQPNEAPEEREAYPAREGNDDERERPHARVPVPA